MPERRILRVFPRRTAYTPDDALVRIGPPGLYDAQELDGKIDEVHISCVFSWDNYLAFGLHNEWCRALPYIPVRVGGPGWDMIKNPYGRDFTPGLYVKQGVTFTSRGCPNRCPFCLVPWREGALRELPIRPGHIVQDNNLLACSDRHFAAVCEMLSGQKRAAKFVGGFEAERLTIHHLRLLRQLRIEEVWLASDGPSVTRHFLGAVESLREFLPRRKVRAYVLVGFDPAETVASAAARLEAVWASGALPFAQIYRPAEGANPRAAEFRALAREWSRPAAMFANHPPDPHNADGISSTLRMALGPDFDVTVTPISIGAPHA